ncbi:TIGR00645 family protein [Mesorhizobium sp. BAC0120]|uniref:TIGR00645 family protein n=1 Tax=Mesorhizobium sp. BAC0120 TaxID=3090670 RepID=UPI00298D46CC|nr:TIGR00645 family protein [Mesorhizobium sp. BAC0120]MDW6022445.1 TIGR00645 family protein [Mesorhizobium sp. BAC0120]
MKRLELAIESVILASRWLLVVFYLGLALALAVYAVSFGAKLYEFLSTVLVINDTTTILKILGLIDAALVASLVVMVIISGYENFVSRFDEHDGEIQWLGTIDVSSLKIKVASTIVAISSIHLLQVFLNHAQYTTDQLMWLTMMHLAFVFSALLLAFIDRVTALAKGKKKDAEAPDL